MSHDSRGSLRIPENLDVIWSHSSSSNNSGRILNISATGALLQVHDLTATSPEKGKMFKIDSFLHGGDNFLPHEGRIIWSLQEDHNQTIYGLEFINPEERILTKLRERIQKKIMESTNKRKTLSFAGLSLLLILAALLTYVVKEQILLFQRMQSSSQVMLASADQQSELTRSYTSLYHKTIDTLAGVSRELDATKILLAQSQDLLTQVQKENLDLQNQMASLKSPTHAVDPNSIDQASFDKSNQELQQQIALLNEKNNQFSSELFQLKEQMKIFEGDIGNLEEGKALISLFHNRLKLVKTKMLYLKREAFYARVAAQKEHDRMLLRSGNQGYLVKGGMPILKSDTTVSSGNKRVNIDVSFVE